MRILTLKKKKILIIIIIAAIVLLGGFFGRPLLGKYFYQKGINAFNEENWVVATSNFKKATILDPAEAEYFAFLAYANHRQNNPQTEEDYEKALSMDYQTSLFFASLGYFYETTKNDYDLAIDYYKKAIDLKPDEYFSAYERLAGLMISLGREKELVPIVENLAGSYGQPKGYALLSLAYSRNDRFEEAESAINEAIRLDPTNATWITRLGRLFLTENEVDKAIEELEKSRLMDPLNEETLCTLAYVYAVKQPDYQKSISYAQAVIQRTEEGEQMDKRWVLTCYYNLGLAYMASGRNDEAKTTLESYLNMSNGLEDVESSYVTDAENKLHELSQ